MGRISFFFWCLIYSCHVIHGQQLSSPNPQNDPFSITCCNMGRDTGKTSLDCESGYLSQPTVEKSWNDYCLSVFTHCCRKRRTEDFCDKGLDVARIGGDCNLMPVLPVPDSVFMKQCCSACQAGLDSNGGHCNIQAFSIVDQAYISCCKEASQGAPQPNFDDIDNGIEDNHSVKNKPLHPEAPPTAPLNHEPPPHVIKPLAGDQARVDEVTGETERDDQDDHDFCGTCSHGCDKTDDDFRCTCQSGYELASDGKTCQDIDECLGMPCPAHQTCLNFIGTFECSQQSGLQPSDNSHNCDHEEMYDTATARCIGMNDQMTLAQKDSNETVVGVEYLDEPCKQHVCSHGQSCVLNNNGTAICTSDTCALGYQKSNSTGSCLDIDECEEDEDICKNEPGTECFNYDGGHWCQPADGENTIGDDADENGCDAGYSWNPDQKVCEDQDECELDPPVCFRDEKCENEPGTYNCLPIECEEGEKVDDDGNCAAVESCSDGMRFNPVIDDCEDIDECIESNDICGPESVCENTIGSYKCKKDDCPRGFKLGRSWLGTKCDDVDECADGTHNCTAGRLCINTEGSFKCDCPLGFRMAENGTCNDIDECHEHDAITPCHSLTSTCLNTIGSYTCECLKGYKTNGNNGCDDVDECEEEDACAKNSMCTNLMGSFRCQCSVGWSLDKNNNTCLPPSGSECRGITLESDDGPLCECPAGFNKHFAAEAEVCQDIDECADPADNQCSPHEKCFNTYGNVKCVDVTCPPEYDWDPTKSMCINKRFNLQKCLDGVNFCVKRYPEAATISHVLIALKSNESISEPRLLYQIKGLDVPNMDFIFNLSPPIVTFPHEMDEGVLAGAEDTHFLFEPHFSQETSKQINNRPALFLQQRLTGPQDIQMTIDVSVNSTLNELKLLHTSILHIFISKYDGISFN